MYSGFLFVWVAHKAHNFVVGLTNVSPNISTPTLFNYILCGQYPGSVPAAATVSLYCQDNLPPFRYVIVQFPLNYHMVLCELEVLVRGMKCRIFLCFQLFVSAAVQDGWTVLLCSLMQRLINKDDICNGVCYMFYCTTQNTVSYVVEIEEAG